MLEFLSGLIIHFIQTTSYVGIFVLMALESALIPIPSEVTMPFSGFLASTGALNFWLVVIVGAIANLAGSLLAYAIGFYLEESVILNLIRRWGKFILITEHEYLRAVAWFKKYGNPIAFFSRLLPAVRTFISLPAGLSEMNVWKFSIYTFAGSFLWSLILTYIGYTLGQNWHTLEPYYRKFEIVIAVILVILVLIYVNRKLKIIKLKIF